MTRPRLDYAGPRTPGPRKSLLPILLLIFVAILVASIFLPSL